MLNIETQACGLVIDAILLYFYMRHDRVGLYSERIFGLSLLVNTLCVFFDILSVFGIVYEEFTHSFWTGVFCKVYLVSLVASAYLGFVYSFSDVYHLRKNNAFKTGVRCTAIAGVILVSVLPVHWQRTAVSVFSYGPSAMCTYVFAPLFIISSFLLTFIFAKQMNVHRRKAVRAWMLAELLAAVIQFVFPEILLVGFGASVGIVILYSELENPEAYTDRSTGCFSSSTLASYVRQCYETNRNFSIILITLSDELKVTQEIHQQVMVEISEFLHSFSSAKLFRGEGNNFALIYPGKPGDTQAIESGLNLDVIRQRFEKPWADTINLSAHFIYAKDSDIASSQDELSMMMNYYKEKSINDIKTILLTKESCSHIREVQATITEIKNAIANDKVEVFYQPIYSISDGRFVSAEALARLRDEDNNIIMPGRFIPVAEKYGYIEEIGEKVFRKTCHALTQTNMRELGIEYVEVNLSIAQCENSKLAATYQNIMEEFALAPNHINLEITESSALTKRNIMLDNMESLLALGCEFSLDDFGTGESNLNYIMDMPVQIVKFDRGMTQEYFKSERAQIVMNATIKMIKELGLKIVAEGIETQEQLATMANLGVDYIQGFYFSKPLPQAEFISYIANMNQA